MKKLLLGLMMLFAFSYTFSQVEGTWKVAPQAAAMGVGPAQGDISWWSNSEGDLTTRACFFDDTFVFNEDGSFNNVMGDETWLEVWQGVSTDQCGTPVYPHDGSNPATWDYNAGAGTLTLDGTGAHIAIAKVINGAELTDPSQAPASITYIVTEISSISMTIDIEIQGGGWWRFILAKEAASGEDATLSDLQVDGSTINGFLPGITEYSYGLEPGTTDIPQITLVTPTDPDVSGIVITQAGSIPGDATVEVTAANGTTTMTYTVSFAITYALTLPVTFENEGINYDLFDFEGMGASEIVVDPTNAANNVVKSFKPETAGTSAGTTVGEPAGFSEQIPFEPGSTFMTVRVWSPTAGTPIRLKVEDSSDPNKSVETETLTTIGSDWENILFDFSNEAPGTEPINFDYYFNKASIFFDFGSPGLTGGTTYYWDDMAFGDLTSIESRTIQTLTFMQNPVQDVLTLNSAINIESIHVYGLSGQSFNVREISKNSYDLSDLSKGLYTVLVIDANGNNLVGKVLKQ